jgi:endonuclease YncB( thermonuclease family)
MGDATQMSMEGGRSALRGRWLAGCLLGLAGLGLQLPASAATAVWSGAVTHVSDGDTLWVRPHAGGAPRSIRLDGIDAPELCQAHGEAARSALAARAMGQTVQVRVRAHDDYGRALARVSLRGEDLGGWLVSQGHAWSYRYRGQSGPYARLEARARGQRLGLFHQGQAERPREFRRRHGACH